MRLNAAKKPPKYFKTPHYTEEQREKVCKEESRKWHSKYDDASGEKAK